jgi:hypothetical protein
MGLLFPLRAQDQPNNEFRELKGLVIDSNTKEALILATISVQEDNLSTVTNSEGAFTLKIPSSMTEGYIQVSFLGYQTQNLPFSIFGEDPLRIDMLEVATPLNEVNIVVPRSPESLVREVLLKKDENYLDKYAKMTAFYREIIRKRKKNIALSEAVVQVYKSPYSQNRQDAVQLFKARKSTDYSRLDTLTLKLQGGPFNALYQDLIKYQDYLFSADYIDDYTFTYERETRIDDVPITVIGFRQKPEILSPLYQGRLYIDSKRKVLVSAVYALNITDTKLASAMFVKRKPAQATVSPRSISYRVDYREKNGKWYYGYSNAVLEFKVDWDKRLFNSVFSLTCEMAVTEWEYILEEEIPKNRDLIKTSVILNDEAEGFSDPDFWGAYNIIEPDKSIESAIRKIQRQLRQTKN